MSNIKTYADYARKYADDLYAPYNPTGAFPLDTRSFFENLEAAQEAARNAVAIGGSGSTYYHGQLVGVLEYPEGLDNSAKGVATYYIIQPNGILSPIGSGNASTIGLEYSEPQWDDPTQQYYCKVTGLGACTDAEIFIPIVSPSGAIVNGITEKAFKSAKITKVSIPHTVITIGNAAFAQCEQLESVELAEGLIYIDDYAFQACNALSQISLPSTLTGLGHGVFMECSQLQEAILSPNLTLLGNGVFASCTNLKSLVVYDLITTLPAQLCRGCDSLEFCVLPKTIDLSASEIFGFCTNLKTIYYAGTAQDWLEVPKHNTTWKTSSDGLTWYLRTDPAIVYGNPVEIIYEFADTVYELNTKLNSKILNLASKLSAAETAAEAKLTAHTAEMTKQATESHTTINQTITTLDNTLTTKITTQRTEINASISTFKAAVEADFTKVNNVMDAANNNLLSLTEIESEEDSYCLSIDPSVFNSNK